MRHFRGCQFALEWTQNKKLTKQLGKDQMPNEAEVYYCGNFLEEERREQGDQIIAIADNDARVC